MATDNLSQSRKRKIPKSDETKAKRARENHDSSSNSIDWESEPVAGKVKRMLLKNFMCHDALEVHFNQRVNFIVGANGSGKSAILTALIVGLGAKAKYANRGPTAKEFIKKGKNKASVEITITNEGPMAFKYEKYGDSITIIRTIGVASTYVVKNWRGEVMSKKKQDVDKIISCLNIQVDNPISVLNQDVSRSFLVTAGDKDKYELMMRATRLDAISSNYKQASKASEEAKGKLRIAVDSLKCEEKEIKKLEKKVYALESLDSVRNEHKALQNELPWAEVAQEEQELLKIDVKIKEQENKIEDLKNVEVTKALKVKEIDSKIENLKKEIADAETESSESSSKLTEIKKRLVELKKTHDQKKEKVRSFHQKIKNQENDITLMKKEIANLEKEQAASHKKQDAKDELTKCELELDSVEASYKTKQTDMMHLEENNRIIEQEEQSIKIQYENKDRAIKKLKHRLSDLKNQPNDGISVFGGNMPRLIRRLREEFQRGKFEKMPVGPIGQYIKVRDSSWIPAVENQLGFGFLSSFCVDNKKDNHVFGLIVKEVFRGDRPPQVNISKFFDQVHDTRDGCTRSSRYSNLLDAMEINHPVVANCLIDQKEIECALLIPTSEEACDVMSEAPRVPPNCKRAFTKQADLFYPDPNYRTYGGSVSNQPKFLQVSTDQAVRSIEEEISVGEQELQILKQKYEEIKERKGKNKSELYQVQDLIQKLTRQQRCLKSKIDELKEVLEICNNNTLNTFVMELEELKKQVAEKKETEGKLMEDVRNSAKNVEAVNEEYKSCRDLSNNLEAKITPIKEKIKDLLDEKKRVSFTNQGSNRKLEETKQHLQKLNGEQQQQQRVVNSKISIAEKSCSRIDTNKSIVDLNNRIKELKLMIDQVEKQNGSLDELKVQLETKKEKFEELHKMTVKLQQTNDKQIERLRKRKIFFNQMKKEISERVQQAFTNVLKLRSFKGKVIIDHDRKELLLEVVPNADGKKSNSDAKSLSGGERSYSTVAFILALWETIGLPFYFLDEFDVFMDKVNRRVVMDILLNHALSHPECQFGFLTPLDTSHITANNSIKIHRLAAPERTV